MRVKVYERPDKPKEFFTMKEAAAHYGKTINQLRRIYKVERVYSAGHWDDVDLDFLKEVAVARYGSKKPPRCLII
jgi:hypothetical protein